jgi:PsbP-like protein/zinc-ribbon domain
MVRCENCGNENDMDATFCEKCGANLKAQQSSFRRGSRSSQRGEGMATSTKLLIVAVVVLVAGLGVSAGVLMQMNKATTPTTPATTPAKNNSSNTHKSNTHKNPTSSIVKYQTFSNNFISFQYPSSWNVLNNNPNQMANVGYSNYPSFGVYDESKYGITSLSDYIAQTESQQSSDGFSILSEQSRTVDGLPAYEIFFQGQSTKGVMVIQQIDLVEKTPGTEYFALIGVDTVDHFNQERSTFNQILDSFKFLQ